jgi:hypothetical protein
MIALEDLDVDVVPLQPLRQAQATCSCSNDADPEPFVAHRAPLHAFAVAERPTMSGDNDGFWQRFRHARIRPANARRMEEAALILESNDDTIARIATRVGYENNAGIFEGVPPGRYRGSAQRYRRSLRDRAIAVNQPATSALGQTQK